MPNFFTREFELETTISQSIDRKQLIGDVKIVSIIIEFIGEWKIRYSRETKC